MFRQNDLVDLDLKLPLRFLCAFENLFCHHTVSIPRINLPLSRAQRIYLNIWRI